MWDSTNIQWGLLSEYWGLPRRRLLLVVSSKPVAGFEPLDFGMPKWHQKRRNGPAEMGTGQSL